MSEYPILRVFPVIGLAETSADLGRVSNRTKCDLKSDMAEALPGASNRTGRGLALSAPNRRNSLFTTRAVLRPLTTYGVRTKWGWYGKRPDLLRNFRSGTQAEPSWFCADELLTNHQPDARRTLGQKNVCRCFAWVCRKTAGPATNGGWLRTEPCTGRHNIRAQGNRSSPVATRLTAKSNYVCFKPCPPRSEIDMAESWTIQRCPKFSGHLIRVNDMRDFPG